MPAENEILEKWLHSVRRTNQGERYAATQKATACKAEGFTANDALDLMTGEAFDVDLSREVIAQVFGDKNTGATAPEPTKKAFVVPTNYRDVVPVIENALRTMAPSAFVAKLMDSEIPIVRASRRNRESWMRLATQALTDPVALKFLHDDLRPWVEEAMLRSVLAAENTPLKVTASDTNQYRVASKEHVANVCFETGTCDCERYVKSNFNEVGTACEHLVGALISTRPYERLQRALNNK